MDSQRIGAKTLRCSPITVLHHNSAATQALTTDGPQRFGEPACFGFLFLSLCTSYDGDVSSSPSAPRTREVLPGGVVATRRSIRRRGGITSIVFAFGLWLCGLVLSWIFSGPLGGTLSFLFTVMAVPAMPLFGIPATSGDHNVLLAIGVSAIAWWFVGQMAAGRVTKSPVVGWREWTKEFVVLGSALWLGAAGGLLLAALLLGAA